MSPGTYTIDQLAVVFQRSASTLRGYLDELTTRHGFPAALPCFENLWSKPAVERWLELNGRPAEFAADPFPPPPGALSLARKYGAAS